VNGFVANKKTSKEHYYHTHMSLLHSSLLLLLLLLPQPTTGSSEADEIYKICSVLGTPSQRSWAEGLKLANQMSFRFPQFVATPISSIIPDASPEAVAIMTDLLKWDPNQRPSASQALQYPFFQVRRRGDRRSKSSSSCCY